MVKIFGYSDDLVEIEGSNYKEEIDCFYRDVRIWFKDGTIIRIGYSKPNMAVWYIQIEQKGSAEQMLKICEDEDDDPYSDIFWIDAEIKQHRVIKQNKKQL